MYLSSRRLGEAAGSASIIPDQDCELQPLTGGRYSLKLRGQLPPKWLANLTSALASRHISIHRGEASKVTASFWQSAFEIAPADGGRLPFDLDWLALARTAPAASAAGSPIHLDAYALDQKNDSLFVEVKGPDSVGFLTALLKTFAFFSLFPAEVRIETPGGRVHDRFWLKGVGGLSPSESSRQGLKIELDKLREKR